MRRKRSTPMFTIPREQLLEMVDFAHAATEYEVRDDGLTYSYPTSRIQWQVRYAYGVEPSRRTVRRWLADWECRADDCACHRVGRLTAGTPDNFRFDGDLAVLWAEAAAA